MEFDEFINTRVIDCHVHHRISGDNLNPAYLTAQDGALSETIEKSRLSQMYVFGKRDHACLYLKAKSPGKYYAGGYAPWTGEATDFDVSDWDGYVSSLKELGYDGIGEMGSKTVTRELHTPLNSDYYEGFWRSCETQDFPVLCHIGDVEDFWREETTPEWAKKRGWGYWDGDYPGFEELTEELFDVLGEYPDLKIVLCHFLFMTPELERTAELLGEYPNLNLDLSLGVELMYNISRRRDEWRDLFIRHGDRLFMGTDIGMSSTVEQHVARVWMIRNFLESDEQFYTPDAADEYLTRYSEPYIGLRLPRATLTKIYSENFQRLWGKTPVDVDIDMAIAVCETEKNAEMMEALQAMKT